MGEKLLYSVGDERHLHSHFRMRVATTAGTASAAAASPPSSSRRRGDARCRARAVRWSARTDASSFVVVVVARRVGHRVDVDARRDRAIVRPRATDVERGARGDGGDGDDATTTADELLRDELRARMAEAEAAGDVREEEDVLYDDRAFSHDDDLDLGDGGRNKYRITIRDKEVLRYELPNFFPDFNPTPLESRIEAGTRDELGGSASGERKRKKNKSYVWKRGVLAGTERSDPLDVIKRSRDESYDDNDDDATTPTGRRTIPPPPRRAVDEEYARRGGGAGSGALAGLTLFFYVVALALTTSRAYFDGGEMIPAPIDAETERGARTAAPPPKSIEGTDAGRVWSEGIERFR